MCPMRTKRRMRMIPEEEYRESPCKLCLVYAICNETCPETDNYLSNSEFIDRYAGEVLSREANHWSKK